jgi:Flp pilus assembly protein TadG
VATIRRRTRPNSVHARGVPETGISRARREDGQAIVEFTLILPVFLGLVFIAIGYGITLNNYLRVTDLTRDAARAGAVARFTGNDPCDTALTTATNAATREGLTVVTAGPNASKCTYPNTNKNPGDPIEVSITIQSPNAIGTIPFISRALPDTLTSASMVLLQ